MRLDAWLANKYPEFSRATVQKLIKSGQATVDGTVITKPSYEVAETQTVSFTPPTAPDFSVDSSQFAASVIFENANVVVINKPAGMLTHAKGAMAEEFTVADFVRSKFDQTESVANAGNNRLGIVHRLDRATSGLLICAKNLATAHYLQRQFADRKAHKTYFALVERTPKQLAAQINLPIARNVRKPATFQVDPKGKPAITDYRVTEQFDDGTALVELKPHTGRTHQLRVHLSYIGAPIVGDPIYGNGQFGDRLMLHAAALEITVPTGHGNERMTFEAPLPTDFMAELERHRD